MKRTAVTQTAQLPGNLWYWSIISSACVHNAYFNIGLNIWVLLYSMYSNPPGGQFFFRFFEWLCSEWLVQIPNWVWRVCQKILQSICACQIWGIFLSPFLDYFGFSLTYIKEFHHRPCCNFSGVFHVKQNSSVWGVCWCAAVRPRGEGPLRHIWRGNITDSQPISMDNTIMLSNI